MGACHWCVICPGRFTVRVYFINFILYAIIDMLYVYAICLCMAVWLCQVLIVPGCYVRCSMCWCCRNQCFVSVSVFRAGVWPLCRVWIERGLLSLVRWIARVPGSINHSVNPFFLGCPQGKWHGVGKAAD